MEDERYPGGAAGCDTAASPDYELARRLRRLSPEMSREVDKVVSRMEGATVANQAGQAMPKGAEGGVYGFGRSVESLTEDNVYEVFLYHPWDSQQQRAGAIVVEALVAAAKAILRNVPPCADRTVALRKLREARMDANSAITHRGRF